MLRAAALLGMDASYLPLHLPGQDGAAPVPLPGTIPTRSGGRGRQAPAAQPEPSLYSYQAAESAENRTHPLPTPIPLLAGALPPRVPTFRVPAVPQSPAQPSPGGVEAAGANSRLTGLSLAGTTTHPWPRPRGEASGWEQEPGRKRAPAGPVPRQAPKGNSRRFGEAAAPRGREPVLAAGAVT